MSCPGGNYVVPGADPCAGGGGGGAIESINGLVGAITFDSSDSTMNVAATSATNITITNPNLVTLNGRQGLVTLTSSDDSVTITSGVVSADNIDLSVAGGGPLVLHFSGQTDITGTYTNLLGPEEGYIMLDKNYAVTVTQSTLTANPISIVITKANDRVIINTYQNSTTPEPSIQFDAILVATNYRKAVPTLTFVDLAIVPVADGSVPGGGSPENFGAIDTGPIYSTPNTPTYINPTLNPTVLMQLTVAGQIATQFISNNTLGYGVYGTGTDNVICGFSMPTPATVTPVNYGVGIPSGTSNPNAVFSATIPYALLSTVGTMNYGLFLSFPTGATPMGWFNVLFQIRLNYYIYA